jgi:hypothetical protein
MLLKSGLQVRSCWGFSSVGADHPFRPNSLQDRVVQYHAEVQNDALFECPDIENIFLVSSLGYCGIDDHLLGQGRLAEIRIDFIHLGIGLLANFSTERIGRSENFQRGVKLGLRFSREASLNPGDQNRPEKPQM